MVSERTKLRIEVAALAALMVVLTASIPLCPHPKNLSAVLIYGVALPLFYVLAIDAFDRMMLLEGRKKRILGWRTKAKMCFLLSLILLWMMVASDMIFIPLHLSTVFDIPLPLHAVLAATLLVLIIIVYWSYMQDVFPNLRR